MKIQILYEYIPPRCDIYKCFSHLERDVEFHPKAVDDNATNEKEKWVIVQNKRKDNKKNAVWKEKKAAELLKQDSMTATNTNNNVGSQEKITTKEGEVLCSPVTPGHELKGNRISPLSLDEEEEIHEHEGILLSGAALKKLKLLLGGMPNPVNVDAP